jgi:hypothetical protein
VPQTVLLLARKRDHPVGHAEIVADGKVVSAVADDSVDVREDRDVEEVVAQVRVGQAIALATQHELDIGWPVVTVPALDDLLRREGAAGNRCPLGQGGDVGVIAREHPFEIPPPYSASIPKEQDHIGQLHVGGDLFGGQRPVPVPAYGLPYRVQQRIVGQVEVFSVEAQRLEVAGRVDQPQARIFQRQLPQVLGRVNRFLLADTLSTSVYDHVSHCVWVTTPTCSIILNSTRWWRWSSLNPITRVGTQCSLGRLLSMRACYSAKLVVSFH